MKRAADVSYDENHEGRRKPMKQFSAMIFAALLVMSAGSHAAGAAPQSALSLEKIMADPDWMGPAVRDAYWSADGRAVYYSLKRPGSPISDLHRMDSQSGKDQVVDAAAMSGADAAESRG